MNTLQLLLAEIAYRKLNFGLALLAVTAAVGLFVAGPLLVDAHSRQTQAELGAMEARVNESAQRLAEAEKQSADELEGLVDDARKLMRDLGFNLMLVPGQTDLYEFHASRVPAADLPEELVERLAKDQRLNTVTHLVATLRGKADWQGRSTMLVGWLPEVSQKHMKHESPMGLVLEPGTVQLGSALAPDKQAGDTIELGGKKFQVAGRLPEEGTDEDIAINLHLADAQQLLHLPGKINVIMALECRCPIDALPLIQQQVDKVAPGTLRALRDKTKAEARQAMRNAVGEKHQQLVGRQKETLAEQQQSLAETAQRRLHVQQLMEALVSLVTPLVVLVSGIWVGLLAMANVRERRYEIGLLRALGKSSAMIAGLFLGKAILLGLLGAGLGFALGTAVAAALGPRMLEMASQSVALRYDVLVSALIGAPLVAAIASYLPTLTALLQDPATALRDQ